MDEWMCWEEEMRSLNDLIFNIFSKFLIFIYLNFDLILSGTSFIRSWTFCSIFGASFRILYQLFCVEHAIQVRSPGKAKNWQVVRKLP
jgi:hypothetical protein